MESKKIMVWIMIGLFALGGLGMMSFGSFNKEGTNHVNMNKPQMSLFKGTITNIKTSPGNVSGMGVYDRTCKQIGNGLTRCDAGIRTEKYGILNFNYIHNMEAEPCIVSGDKLQVEILDSNGTARILKI